MEQTSRASRAFLSTALVLALLAGAFCSRILDRPSWHLQRLVSLDRGHEAELWRLDHIDRNYSVYVDGRKVFVSEDFAPRSDIPFRETLFWDRTGRLLILEIGGHRVFGYDMTAERRLTDTELLAAKPPPEPSLWDYSSETVWPGIGLAPRPTADDPASQSTGPERFPTDPARP